MRKLLPLLVALPLAAACSDPNAGAKEVALRYLAEAPPAPDDVPIPLPAGAELDVARMKVQRAADAYRDVVNGKAPLSGTAKTYWFVTPMTPEDVVAFYRTQPGADPRAMPVQTKPDACSAPRLGDADRFPGVRAPGAAPSGPCKQAVIKLGETAIALQRPTPDPLAATWSDVTSLRVLFRKR